MKVFRTTLAVLGCAAIVYFGGDKLDIWPETVTGPVNAAFDCLSELSLKLTGATTAQAGEEQDAGAEKQYSQEQVVAAWDEIAGSLNEMALNGDTEGFAAAVKQPVEQAQATMQWLVDESYTGYNRSNSYIVFQYDNYYYMETVKYLVTGTETDNNQSAMNLRGQIMNIDGRWEICAAEELPEEFINMVYSLYGDGCAEAYRDGRNVMIFDNFMWTHPELVYQGCCANEIIGAWQNSDGSMDVQFATYNGTSSIRQNQSVTVTITDDTLGTVCEKTVSGQDSVAPGRSKVFTVHLEPSEVYTGTAAWTTMRSSVHVDY